MICVIRICGQVGIKKEIKETLNRLRLRRKYSCRVLKNPTREQIGMIQKVKDFVAYGELSEEMFEKLKKRCGGKDDTFFRLHPPRGGIDSKKHFGVGKGVLGNHGKKIDNLVERMLK